MLRAAGTGFRGFQVIVSKQPAGKSALGVLIGKEPDEGETMCSGSMPCGPVTSGLTSSDQAARRLLVEPGRPGVARDQHVHRDVVLLHPRPRG